MSDTPETIGRLFIGKQYFADKRDLNDIATFENPLFSLEMGPRAYRDMVAENRNPGAYISGISLLLLEQEEPDLFEWIQPLAHDDTPGNWPPHWP